MALADQIRTRRLAQWVSLAELALRVGVSAEYLSQLENHADTPTPPADILSRLGSVLGASVGDLLEQPLPRAEEVAVAEMADVPSGLQRFAQQADLGDVEVRMLAQITYRGARPQSAYDYRFIYEAIRRTIQKYQHRQDEHGPDSEQAGEPADEV